MKNSLKIIAPYVALLIVGFIFGNLISGPEDSCDKTGLRYVNPDLICGNKMIIKKSSYNQLKNKLLLYIEDKKQEEKIANISIYFRDLQNGPTLGINEHELFSPASLLKVPLLITYENLRVEKHPGLFDIKLVVKDFGNSAVQAIPPRYQVEFGKEYSIRELLDSMIKYSDNRAYASLLDYLIELSPEIDPLKETFIDLGIIDPKDYLDNTISVKSYGSMFVQLFHSSFFNQNSVSNEVLDLLTKIDWQGGLNKGVPVNIEIAHKFGERTDSQKNIKQLHDCGIVYYPKNPYLLCVMTRGNDFYELSSVIADVSKMFYEEFNSRKI